jgi:hypothetical protein
VIQRQYVSRRFDWKPTQTFEAYLDDLAGLLRNCKRNFGLDHEAFARQANLRKGTILRIANGTTRCPAWTTVEKIKGVMYAREAFYDRATAMPGEMPAMMPVVHHGQLAFRKRHQPIWQKNAQRRKLQRRYAAHA